MLFDIDGTVIRAGDPAHRAAFEVAMAEVHDTDATLDGIPLGGRLDRQIARDALARSGVAAAAIDASLDRVMDAMTAAYERQVPQDARRDWVLPGVAETASSLARQGACVGVLTGGARGVARHKLGAAGLAHLFPLGAYGCEADDRAALVELAVAEARALGHRIRRDRVVLVGDTPLDVAAAREADAAVIAVATGTWTLDELAATDPDVLLADLDHAGGEAPRPVTELLDALGAPGPPGAG